MTYFAVKFRKWPRDASFLSFWPLAFLVISSHFFSFCFFLCPVCAFCFLLVLLHGRGGERAARRRSWEIDGSGGVDWRWVYAGRELTGAEMVIGEATAACWARVLGSAASGRRLGDRSEIEATSWTMAEADGED